MEPGRGSSRLRPTTRLQIGDSGGHEPSSRVPYGQDASFVVLNSGVDSLYWSARGDVSATLVDLEAYQVEARERGEPQPWRQVDGYSLSVGPRGALGYPIYLDCAEFRIHLGMFKRRPTFWTQLRAEFIHTVGPAEAAAASIAVAEALSVVPLTGVGVARMDLFVDVGGWSLTQGDLKGLVTHAKEIESHSVPRSDVVHSFRAGVFPFLCRIYDKRREVAKKGGFAPAFWGDFAGPVTRVEFEIGSQRLRRFAVRSIPDVLASVGDVWRHGTTNYIALREPTADSPETWRTSEVWQVVQDAVIRFSSSGVVPFLVVKGDRLTTLRALRGYLVTFAAIEGVTTEAEALKRLGASLHEVARGRLFASDVARRAARLPKDYRAGRIA